MILLQLPNHLRTLAGVDGDVEIQVEPATLTSVLDALEASYRVLRRTIRPHNSAQRRSGLRFFASGQDLSHESPDARSPIPSPTGRSHSSLSAPHSAPRFSDRRLAQTLPLDGCAFRF